MSLSAIDIGENSSFTDLSKFFLHKNPDKVLQQRERNLWAALGANQQQVNVQMGMLEKAVAAARTRWACISALSQREQNFKFENGAHYLVETYSNITQIKPQLERDSGIEPPERAGKIMYRFTERSRQRMMSRARKLNTNFMKLPDDTGKRSRVEKDLPVPYFVTLTYHKNMKDCETAKKHLNTFFQRWRRRGADFAYFWKMEPQDRGAVHFHLAMFLPEKFNLRRAVPEGRVKSYIERLKKSGKWDYHNYESVCLMLLISDDWAEVTKEIDGVDVPFTKFDRMRKKRKKTESYRVKGNVREVKTLCSNPRVQYKIEPDWQHRAYGTNVRICKNWKMFLGYVYKYMEKEVAFKNPLTAPKLKGKITAGNVGYEGPPYRFNFSKPYGLKQRNIEWEYNKTGRWWAFSYNLDFKALQTGFVDHKDVKNMNDFCNALNTLAFKSLTEHLIDNADRARKELTGGKLKRKLKHFRNTFESQKKRWRINKDKIKEGFFLQFEIPAAKALKLRYYLKEKALEDLVCNLDERFYNELNAK